MRYHADTIWLVLGNAARKVARAAQTPGADIQGAVRAYARIEKYWGRVSRGWRPRKLNWVR